MINQTLKQIGLSDDEVDTYLCLLKLGAQPASTIARSNNKKRTTVRGHLEKLKKIGLARMYWKGKTQYFVPEKLENCILNLKAKKTIQLQEWDKNIKSFKEIIPELLNFVRPEPIIPKITYYEGIEDLKNMYKDSLSSKTEILCLSSIDDLIELFGLKYDTWYVKKRVKNKIPLRYIAKSSKSEIEETKKDKDLLRKSKHISNKIFDISNEINIYDGKVSIITLKNEKIGVIIQSKEIYNTMKIIFETLWQQAK